MLIESLIKRNGGTVVDIDGQQYHFAPDDNDRHVCEVIDESHINLFLQIPEGYAERRGRGRPKKMVEEVVESITDSADTVDENN